MDAPPPPDLAEAGAPTAAAVASRAVMVAVMLERARLEATGEVQALSRLSALAAQHGLLENLGPEGVALFQADPGAWSEDDLEAVRWTAEELHLLLWALGKLALPSLIARTEAATALAVVPLAGDVGAFLEGATLRPVEELEDQYTRWDVLLQVVESEVYVRTVLEDPAQLEGDDELEPLLAAAEAQGFDRAAAARAGPGQAVAQGLRFQVRALLAELFGAGGLPGAERLDADALAALPELELATLYGLAHTRVGALAWLVEGDAPEDELPA